MKNHIRGRKVFSMNFRDKVSISSFFMFYLSVWYKKDPIFPEHVWPMNNPFLKKNLWKDSIKNKMPLRVKIICTQKQAQKRKNSFQEIQTVKFQGRHQSSFFTTLRWLFKYISTNMSITQSKNWRTRKLIDFENLLIKNERLNSKWLPCCSKTSRNKHTANGARVLGKIALDRLNQKKF